MKCIVQYRGKEDDCYCNKLKECSKCNSKDNRNTEDNCQVTINGFCTCRLCGNAVKS